MVRSLVTQLSHQCVRILPGFEALFSTCENGQRQPSLNALLNVLQELINDFPSTYFVIDALDECKNRGELMRIIKTISTWQSQGLHMLFTSRREGDIKLTLESILDSQNILCIQTDAVDHDIQLYVRQQLKDDESLRKWQTNDAIRKRIETSLREKAHGMFRLAACQLDILRRCRNRKQLLSALDSLPPDLDETYNRILGAIKGDDIIYAVRILRWLTFSLEPLSLLEVAEVVALDADRHPAFDRDEVLEDHSDILSICSSLVTTTVSRFRKEPVVLLAHYSVKEYLVSGRILDSEAKMYGMENALCHSTIAKCCIGYLLQFDTE
ncbi:hypothetical protein P154DRAFT_420933, partial [Amniculicola lignicola CBS 123094]